MIYWRSKTILITPHQSIVTDRSCDKNAAPRLNFFELSNEDTLQFSQGTCLTRDSAVAPLRNIRDLSL